MINLKGAYFKYAKSINEIKVHGNVIKFHCHASDHGFIYEHEIENKTNEEMSIILSKQDFEFLSKFEEFKLNQVDNSIKFTCGKTKLVLKNVIGVNVPTPALDNLNEINVDKQTFNKALKFCGKSDTKFSMNGVNVINNNVIATDSTSIYFKKLNDTKLKTSVNIPKEAFINIPADADYKVEFNESIALITFDDTKLYARLIAQVVPIDLITKMLNTKYDFSIEINKKDLLNDLKNISIFSELVKLEVIGNILYLKGSNQIADIECELDVLNNENGNMSDWFNCKKLIKLVNASEDLMVLKIAEKMIKSDGEDKIFLFKVMLPGGLK